MMRRLFLLFTLFVLLALSSLLVSAHAESPRPKQLDPVGAVPSPDHAADRVLVKFRPDARPAHRADGALQTGMLSLDRVMADQKVQAVKRLFLGAEAQGALKTVGLEQIYALQLAPGSDVAQAVEALAADPSVEWAEPDYLAHPAPVPNDLLFSQQWGLTKIEAPAAWDVTTGSAAVPIAIVDFGLDFSHPDLSGKLWVNPGEIAGNGIDDNHGCVDDVHGWDLVNAGKPAGCTDHWGNPLLTDQWGESRTGRCDMGAYEYQHLGLSPSVKTANVAFAMPGDPLTYTITVENGEAVEVPGVLVTDTLPVSLTYQDDSLSATAGTFGYANGVVTWTGSLSATGCVTITFGATVSPTAPFGTEVVNSAIITGNGETITRTVRLYVGYSAYLPLVTKTPPFLFADDFSTDKGWINATSDHFFRDADNEWLSWHVDRSSLEQYYIPIEPFSGDFRLQARVEATYFSQCNLYIGLVEDMGYVWPTTATGAFFAIGWWGGAGPDYFINPWINFMDGTPTVAWDPADPSTWISYNPATWYSIILKIEDTTWEIAVYTDSGADVGRIHGVMPSNHSSYHYIMLANQDDGDWPTGDGLLDDLVLERIGE